MVDKLTILHYICVVINNTEYSDMFTNVTRKQIIIAAGAAFFVVATAVAAVINVSATTNAQPVPEIFVDETYVVE